MKALVYKGPKLMEIEEWEIPAPEKGYVQVTPKLVGICGSDIHGYLGTTGRRIAPMVMGHEMSGIISAIGEGVSGLKIGDRVTIQPIIPCGRCDYCRDGVINICPDRKLLGTMSTNGTFAERICVPEANICKLPDNISYEVGALIEPFAVAYRAIAHVQPVKDKTILVCGSGAIGLMILILLKTFQAGRVIMVDINEFRLGIAKRYGADVAINSEKEDIGSYLKANNLINAIDIAFEAVGITPAVQMTADYVRNRGMIVWVGNSERMVTLNMQNIVTREISIKGTYVYTDEDFRDSIELLRRSDLDFTNIIGGIVPFDKAAEAFEEIAGNEGKKIKVLVEI